MLDHDRAVIESLKDPNFFQYFYDQTTLGEATGSLAGKKIERHPNREILLALNGNPDYVLNGNLFQAYPGSVFFIDHWIPHQFGYQIKDTPFTHIWIYFFGKTRLCANLWDTESDATLPIYHRKTICCSYELCVLLDKRWDQMNNCDDDSRNRLGLQKNIIHLLCEELQFNWASPSNLVRSKRDVAEQIKNYILINSGRNSSIAELEKFSGYSRYYLMRLFKAQTGSTILEYINHVRRKIVTEALGQKVPQKEIAYQLGFSSPASFWQWKKRMM